MVRIQGDQSSVVGRIDDKAPSAGAEDNTLSFPKTAFEQQLAQPSNFERSISMPGLAEQFSDKGPETILTGDFQEHDTPAADSLQVLAENDRLLREHAERHSWIEIEITCDMPCGEEPTLPPEEDNETHHDEVEVRTPAQVGEPGRPPAGSGINPAPLQPTPVAWVTDVLPNTPGARRVAAPYAETAQVPRTTLAFEAAPDWVKRLPPPFVVATALLLYGRPAGDASVFGFPADDDVRVVLDGTMRGPSHVEIGGVDSGILVHPVYDDAGNISGFAPDSFFDQHELHKLTGAWIALSENGSAENSPVVRVGAGSVTGQPKELTGDAENRRSTWVENRTGLLLAEDEGSHLERVPEEGGTGDERLTRPDYLDINTGERIDVYSPITPNVLNLRNNAFDKFNRDQADRVVINLGDSPLDVADVIDALTTRSNGEPTFRQGPITIIDRYGNFHRVPASSETPSDSREPLAGAA